jgi:hypothetical protein
VVKYKSRRLIPQPVRLPPLPTFENHPVIADVHRRVKALNADPEWRQTVKAVQAFNKQFVQPLREEDVETEQARRAPAAAPKHRGGRPREYTDKELACLFEPARRLRKQSLYRDNDDRLAKKLRDDHWPKDHAKSAPNTGVIKRWVIKKL